ncbi:hypothetical protein N7510_007667 [Penicillium lagena]|uniref:uncharacterized protein n=1 Tax=Penicillium lagena TaxID=94218 RepID=UPI002540BFF9|nr:uncharacterized protein N7510_007667 [Penicillium lagena]KAJ5610948.1 hypothetical protein N7510_007667 [Penicillium lagena]
MALPRAPLLLCFLLLLPHVHAFGAGNIASISAVEGQNWRHGDIEDVLKTIACISGHKWTSTMIKRVYFGNWLRDYSQAMDTGTLKNLQADTIRILVWILSFLSFGYATAEFEVTSDRLGVYRPEEHIDNPKGYADNQDARQLDKRLRGPVRPVELEIDPDTGMKNYIANERGDWATSAAYVKYSLGRSIHFGRMYTHGGERKGSEEDLCEALRCLGQGLHTLEDFAAHTNYCELALREMGFLNVFPHTGTATQCNIRGHQVFPLVTGTFGMVDFFHSVLGETTDHFTQSEVNEMDVALGDAQSSSQSNSSLNALTGLLGKIPGTRDLVNEAQQLKQQSEAQESVNRRRGSMAGYSQSFSSRCVEDHEIGEQTRAPGPGGSTAPAPGSGPGPGLQGMPDINPQETIKKIYPILEFRDKVVRKLNSIIEKIPGLEALVEKISETLTVFIMSLLAPFVRPLINAASKSLQTGSSGVIDASGKHQYEPWTDPRCTDPTHSMLSKDHFANVLNEPAGHVAAAIVRYVAPRVLYAWEHIDVPDHEVLNDCMNIFHHPTLRDMRNDAHRTMFEAVQSWVNTHPDRRAKLNDILSADGVRAGRNTGGVPHTHGSGSGGGGFAALGGGGAHSHGASASHGSSFLPQLHQQPQGQHGSSGGSGIPWDKLSNLPIPGLSSSGQHQSQGQHSSSGGLPWEQLSHLPIPGLSSSGQHGQHGSSGGLPWDKLSGLPIPGMSELNKLNKISHFVPGGLGHGFSREVEGENEAGTGTAGGPYRQQQAEYEQPQYQSHDEHQNQHQHQHQHQHHHGHGHGHPHQGHGRDGY